MSEPVKKAGQAPGSYSPKDKPEIISMAENALRNKRDGQPPSEFVIAPKEKIAAFSGDRWPYSNVEPAVYSALGLLYGRTDRRDSSGALINDDIEYSIHNVLTGHAFGLFYCLPDDSLSMSFYGLKSCRLNKEDYSDRELTEVIKDLVYGGSAVHINDVGTPFDYLIWGYREDGNILIGHKFEHGNDDVNCSYDFVNPMQFPLSKDIVSVTFYLPDGEKSGHGDIYRQALTVGHSMLTQSEPPPGMDFGRVHFGYGNAIYEEWIRQLERANAENSAAFYFASPVFPHFIALYENRLQLHKFLKLFAEENGNESLLRASVLCGQLKDLAQEGAQIGFENQWSDPEVLAMSNNQRRELLIGLLKKCRALELETASAIKEFIDAPESYSPKDKPEILSMAEKAVKVGTEAAYSVKSANGGSYIDGVPMLKWGEWRDNSYCGCVSALLNAAGISVSYEEVMGLSGVCYQAIMLPNWDPSSQMPQNGLLCEKNVGDALGVSVYTLNDEKEIWQQAKKSIDSGFPVLLVGGRWEPEWTLACGYAVENGGDRFFGRTYFDCQNYNASEKTIEHQSTSVPENEIYTPNGYFYLNGFPGWFPAGLTRFYDKKCEPVSRSQALKVSLETCIAMFEQPSRQYDHKFGYDAYDVLIQGFELSAAEYRAKCNNDQYHIGSLLDARRAAYIYLSACVDLFDDENKTRIEKAVRLYERMTENLLEVVPYEETSAIFNTDSGAVWDTARRKKLSSSLKENKELEKQARLVVQDILEHWREDK